MSAPSNGPVPAPAAAASATLRDTWAQQAAWSAAASNAKKRLERARTLVLCCTIVAALLETLAAQMAGGAAQTGKPLALAGAVLLGIAGFLQLHAASKAQTTAWIRARSVSEALKEAVYRYLVRSGVYRGPDPDARLRDTVLTLTDKARDLQAMLAVTTVAPREPPALGDLKAYVDKRVAGQIDGYYVPRSRELGRRGERWRQVQTATLFAGALLSAVLPYLGDSAGGSTWIAVITTVAGSLGAHIEASRFEQLTIAYQATATRLQALRAEWEDTLSKRSLGDAEIDAFVDRCEDAISVENQAWMAEWAK